MKNIQKIVFEFSLLLLQTVYLCCVSLSTKYIMTSGSVGGCSSMASWRRTMTGSIAW